MYEAHDANKCVLSVAGIGTFCTLYCYIAVAFQGDRLIKKTYEKTTKFVFFIHIYLTTLLASYFLS
jgi:hypothetical protein